MKRLKLTDLSPAARTVMMRSFGQAKRLGVLLGGAMALSACVSVTAPDKPIVIELNINIKQEVIYRLAQDAGNTIEANPEIF